jgi:hypothetical protein
MFFIWHSVSYRRLIMADIRDLFVKINPLVLPASVLGSFRFADWKGAQQRAGSVGLVGEVARSALGTNTVPFFVPETSGWRPSDLSALLMSYGIRIWGVGCFNAEIHFRVKERQADWAQYVLLSAGVPLTHGLLPGTRANPNPDGIDRSKAKAVDEAKVGAGKRFIRFLDRVSSWLD